MKDLRARWVFAVGILLVRHMWHSTELGFVILDWQTARYYDRKLFLRCAAHFLQYSSGFCFAIVINCHQFSLIIVMQTINRFINISLSTLDGNGALQQLRNCFDCFFNGLANVKGRQDSFVLLAHRGSVKNIVISPVCFNQHVMPAVSTPNVGDNTFLKFVNKIVIVFVIYGVFVGSCLVLLQKRWQLRQSLVYQTILIPFKNYVLKIAQLVL